MLKFQEHRWCDSICLNFKSSGGDTRFSWISEAQKMREDFLIPLTQKMYPEEDLLLFLKLRRWDSFVLRFQNLRKSRSIFFFVPEARKMRLALLEFLKLRRCGSLCLNEFQKYKKVWPDLLKFLKLRRWESIFWNLKSSECWFRRWSLIFHFWR